MVEYCAWIHNVRTRGPDGLTAYQRVRGKDFKKRLVPFGELLPVHMPIKGPERREGGALDARAVEGLFFGYGCAFAFLWLLFPSVQPPPVLASG